MSNHSEAIRFLQAVFGSDYASCGIFANLNPPDHFRDVCRLDLRRDCYWSIAAFPPGARTNQLDNAPLNVRALVIDDVGTKGPSAGAVELALGEPTAIVETSPGNFQWSYRLAEPVAKDAWAAFFAEIERLIGTKLEGRDAVHLFRLPCGVNTKKGRNRFQVRLTQLNPGIELSGVTPLVASSTPKRVTGTQCVHDIKRLVALVPNEDLDYDEWIATGQRIKAKAIHEEDGLEAFLELSARSDKNNLKQDTETTWNTLQPSRTTGDRLQDAAWAADPEGYMAWVLAEGPRPGARAAFDDGEELPPVLPGRGSVQFELGSKKEVLRSLTNAKRAIKGLGIACTYDEFHHRIDVRHEGAEAKRYTGLPSDTRILMLRVELTDIYGKDFGTPIVWDAVIALAQEHGFNPVVVMLDEAEQGWDGVKRLDRLGPDYFNTEDTEFARAAFRKTMLAAVRRARQPGCKFDQILVVEGPEGWNKSSAWEVLAGAGNFSDAPILGKDARAVQEELGDVWIHEIADLSGLSKADVEHVKAFASRVNDRARPVYGRTLINQPRQSIEVGTTNADAYLLSTTGNRRFWPCKVLKRINLEKLRQDRLQLWGEAAVAEHAGETLVLPERLWTTAGEEQEKRRAIDTWEAELENLEEIPEGSAVISGAQRIQMRNNEQFITNLSVQEYLSGYRGQHFNSGSGRKIAEIMKRLGWERTVVKIDGKATRGYVRARLSTCNGSVTSSVTKNLF